MDKEKTLTKDLDTLFKKARTEKQFKSYSDSQLKAMLMDIMYSETLTDGMTDTKLIEFLKKSIVSNENKSPKYSKSLSKYKGRKKLKLKENLETIFYQTKDEINIDKFEDINKFKNALDELDKNEKLTRSLVFEKISELSISLPSFTQKRLFDFLTKEEKDFKAFREKIIMLYYEKKTNIIIKLINFLFGLKSEKLKKYDFFKNLPGKLIKEKELIYGKNVYNALHYEEEWFFQLFGIDSSDTKIDDFKIENLSKYNLKCLLEYLSEAVDYIFDNADFINAFPDHNENAGDKNIKEFIFVSMVSHKFTDVVKTVNLIQNLYKIYNFTPEHPLKSGHLIYLFCFLNYYFYDFLQRVTNKNAVFNKEGINTGKMSLDIIFPIIKNYYQTKLDNDDFDGEIEQQLQTANKQDETANETNDFDSFLEKWQSEFSTEMPEEEKQSASVDLREIATRIVKYVDDYYEIFNHLKIRFRKLISSSLADIVSNYLEKEHIYIDYEMNDKGHLVFDPETMVGKKKEKVTVDSLLDESEKVSAGNDKNEAQSESDEMGNEAVNPVANDTEIDVMPYVDCFKSLEDIIDIFNRNFSPQNKFKLTDKSNQKRYDYLKQRNYLKNGDKSGEKVPFDMLIKLQNCYDTLVISKNKLEEVIMPLVRKKSFYIDRALGIELRDVISDVAYVFKDITEILSEISEHKEKFDDYTKYVKFFFTKHKLVLEQFTKQ